MPPPPPPAPPPLPKQSTGASNSRTKSSDPPPDRNALLSQIRKGAQLKKAETNDRSSPLISNKPSSGATAGKNHASKSNGPIPLIPPGGLFAQGIPKLRPTTSKSDSNSNPPMSSVIQSIKQQGNANSTLRVAQLSKSRSQPPSPVSKPRSAAADRLEAVLSSRIANSSCDNSSTSAGNPNFPEDVTIKGPAPAPPPQCQKPNFNRATTDLDPSVRHSTVKRSASQTNLQRPRITRPPNERPPPPPKSNPAPPSTVPPPPPSKPPNILRRQSFGVGEGSRFAAGKQLSVANSTPKPSAKFLGPPPPPPPPRNNSAPNDLNNLMQGSPSSNLTKMNIAPPPPPNRAPAVGTRAVPVRPPPPRAPAPPPPPPPQHHVPTHPAPPSQMKAVPYSPNLAPAPPTRVSSMKQTGLDFEDRFKNMFSSAHSLPKPEKFTNFSKTYPSKAVRQKQSVRRQPPPPPPHGGAHDRNRSQQFDSGFQSGNYNHSLSHVKPNYTKEIFNPNL